MSAGIKRPKLFINIIAEYPPGTHFAEEDIGALQEDIEDAVHYMQGTRPIFRPLIEVETR